MCACCVSLFPWQVRNMFGMKAKESCYLKFWKCEIDSLFFHCTILIGNHRLFSKLFISTLFLSSLEESFIVYFVKDLFCVWWPKDHCCGGEVVLLCNGYHCCKRSFKKTWIQLLCSWSNCTCSILEICDCENLCHGSWFEVRHDAFCWSTIP